MRRFFRRALPIALLAITACGRLKELPTDPGGGGGTPDPSATFSRVQAEIFTPTCALGGCHDTFTQQAGLILTAASSFQSTVGHASLEVTTLKRIEPLSPDNSYLYRKVNGGPNIVGNRMPDGAAPLSDAQLLLLRDWIRRGAPND